MCFLCNLAPLLGVGMYRCAPYIAGIHVSGSQKECQAFRQLIAKNTEWTQKKSGSIKAHTHTREMWFSIYLLYILYRRVSWEKNAPPGPWWWCVKCSNLLQFHCKSVLTHLWCEILCPQQSFSQRVNWSSLMLLRVYECYFSKNLGPFRI